jgi:hypothetical protein
MNNTIYMNQTKSKAADACIHISAIFVRYICTLSICFWSVVAKAESPAPFDGMSFQSYLLDSTKQPITGTKTIKFSIFDAESKGSVQWAETQQVHVLAGNFSVILGQGYWSPIQGYKSRRDLGDVFDGGTRFIEIKVGDNVLTPRLKLLPSAYSFRALTADKLSFNTKPMLDVSDTGTTSYGTLSVAEATSLEGTLSVTKATSLEGTLSVTEDLTVGTTTALKKATVHGDIEAKSPGQFIGFGTVPLGGIIMWSGTDTPDGWAICNGQQITFATGPTIHTPDLSGRFIVGADPDEIGEDHHKKLNTSGGSDQVTLVTKNLPPHRHSGTTNKDGLHEHTGVYGLGGSKVSNDKNYGHLWDRYVTGTVHSQGSDHQHDFNTDDNFNSTMKSTPFSIVPRYYALAYIMRVQ